MMKRFIKIGACFFIFGYLLICVAIYFMQDSMLFPAHLARPVPESWQPTAAERHVQAMLDGHCGKLHAVIWEISAAKGTVMVFHGNGESIASVESQVPPFQQLGYNVMAWDYAGYGRSTPCRFSEKDLLEDAETAYLWLEKQHPPSPIVLYGRSVGTALALYVAKQHPPLSVLLVSPYDALVNVAHDQMPFFMPVELLMRYPLHADQWIGQVQGHIHAIHGLEDTLIKPERAMALIRQAKGSADIEWVEGAGHNDITIFEKSRQWLERCLKDISFQSKTIQTGNTNDQ